jgi:hypothetical protein
VTQQTARKAGPPSEGGKLILTPCPSRDKGELFFRDGQCEKFRYKKINTIAFFENLTPPFAFWNLGAG